MRLPRLPDRVPVLSRDYKIKRVMSSTLLKEHGHECYADCSPQDCTIRIVRGVSLEAAWGYLEHELGHAFVFELGFRPRLEDDKTLEEDIVEKLMPAWLGCIQSLRGNRG